MVHLFPSLLFYKKNLIENKNRKSRPSLQGQEAEDEILKVEGDQVSCLPQGYFSEQGCCADQDWHFPTISGCSPRERVECRDLAAGRWDFHITRLCLPNSALKTQNLKGQRPWFPGGGKGQERPVKTSHFYSFWTGSLPGSERALFFPSAHPGDCHLV